MNFLYPFQSFLLFFSLFFIAMPSYGQPINTLSYDELKELYLKNENNPTQQEKIARTFINKAQHEKDNLQIGRGYNFLYACLSKSENEKIKLLDSVIKYTKNDWVKEYDFPEKAYVLKANHLRLEYKFEQAINNLLIAEKYCKEKRSNYIYWVYFYMAIIKSEDLGQLNEAHLINRKVYKFLKNNNDNKYSKLYTNILFSLADDFKSLKQVDSCSYYNRLGYKNAIINQDTMYKHLFVLNEGANLITQKKYTTAIDSIKKSLPYIIKAKYIGNSLAGYYYLGKAYEGLQQPLKAVQNYQKVDSIYIIHKEMSFEFCDGYNFLIEYYKKKGDSRNQLKYLMTKNSIDSLLNTNYRELSQKIKNEYDTPHLMDAKEQEISNAYNWVYVLIILFIIIISLLYYVKNKKIKHYKARLETFVDQFNHEVEIHTTTEVEQKELEAVENTTGEVIKKITMHTDTFNEIVEKLILFEKEELFFNPEMNATILATSIATNPKYLAEVIKETKQKTVYQYINDLRINHGLKKLQSNKKLLHYNTEALAKEFGFNSYRTFKKTFFTVTQIEFSDFLQKIPSTDN